MLAYSSIAHTGYITAAIASGTEYGVQALIFYSLIYLFMAIGSFIFLTAMEKDMKWTNDLNDFKGLARKNPMMALFMLIIMFSLLGIPPTVGFMGKLGVFISLVSAEMWWLAIVLIVMSIVSAGYYLRVVIYMYFYDPVNDNNPKLTAPEVFTVSFASIIILILGIYPTIVLNISEIMTQSLLRMIGL
jgi:NADH-quinone oxidoreductase subunit N